jgi:hypothetical protein
MPGSKIPYAAQKESIRSELVRLAKAGRTITYGELGQILGIPARGPWKPVLDEISREETARQRPDITYLVVAKTSGLPGQIKFEAAKPPTLEQRAIADQIIRNVFDWYG